MAEAYFFGVCIFLPGIRLRVFLYTPYPPPVSGSRGRQKGTGGYVRKFYKKFDSALAR